MKKNLSLLKPYVHTAVFNNEIMEKATYLNVPGTVDLKSLKADVRKGAKQFAELDKLIEKENEPKYIIISTDNLEQGYMAVTYLAAGFNEKHKMSLDFEEKCDPEETETNLEEWMENEWQIPIIQEYDLNQSMSGGNDPFAFNGMFMQGNQNGLQHMPYWMNCTNHSVCIVAEDDNGFGCGFGFANEIQEQPIFDGLKHFKGNDKVYVIILASSHQWMDEEDLEDDTWELDTTRGKWNSIVLSFAADEVTVKLKEEVVKPYYKLLFQGVFGKKDIIPQKGFSYDRLINMISSMQDKNKCQLIENIVQYAVKDWKDFEDRMITNQDFAFMDRFCRTEKFVAEKKRPKRAMDRLMNELIGMDDIKQQVCNIVNVMKYNKLREKMKIGAGSYHNVHIMLGAPGTAKTTVAQLMGQIMVEEHLLQDNRFTCVNGAELKGMYVGHSAPKTKALFEENDIIVIDEAYSLVGDYGESDSFSKEAIAQLIIEIEKHSTDKLVIFAGYGGKNVKEKDNKMKAFLDSNPGIKSRITSTFYFPSYSAEEMGNIFMSIAKNQKYHIEEEVRTIVVKHFEKRIHADNFGNGREARSLLETSVVYAANRILQQNKKKYTKAEMQTITYEDVKAAIMQVEKSEDIQNAAIRRKIGF